MSKMRAALALIAAAVLAPGLIVAQQPAANMSFFVTSAGSGNGANLGGLEGADRICQNLAQAAGAGNKTWRAYLSTQGENRVDARSRIGNGPWYNARGVMIAENADELHLNNNVRKNTALNERGEVVAGRGDQPRNRHDMLTGSSPDGVGFGGSEDRTCSNWTSNGSEGSAMVGHHDRVGGGSLSWNSVHPSRGCSQENLISTGGDGLFYCFAIN